MKTTSTIVCPSCKHSKTRDLPTNICAHSYTCKKCKNALKSTKGNSSMNRGFTLVELLMVIIVIGILSAIFVGKVTTARGKARISQAQANLINARTAIALLQNDTDKWPNGCPPNVISNPEVALDDEDAGIRIVPTVGVNGPGCEWTAQDIANWKGPYMQTPVDPWGTSYWFDPDFTPYEGCVSITTQSEKSGVVSFGPNKVGLNIYDCDDIFLEI